MSDLAGRTCLITGATRGIGRTAAQALAKMGATIIVHGRDSAAVGAVCREIVASTGNTQVTGAVADFSELGDVRRLAREVAERHGRLDVLLNNAGTSAPRRRVTADGFEWLFGVNHLAPFLLTHLLLEKLTASAPARIVTVASQAYRRGALDFDDLNWERRPYGAWQAYGASKLANILFTLELARRIDGSGVTANCLHPGVVATNIFNHLGLFGRLFTRLARPLLLDSDAGAKTSVYLASSADVANVSGKFFDRCREATLTPAAKDPATARRLWEISAQLTAVSP
jgi:NAD(P)-dependent dehydrogenase (short-subunit alcohol dehydrogenase family)